MRNSSSFDLLIFIPILCVMTGMEAVMLATMDVMTGMGKITDKPRQFVAWHGSYIIFLISLIAINTATPQTTKADTLFSSAISFPLESNFPK